MPGRGQCSEAISSLWLCPLLKLVVMLLTDVCIPSRGQHLLLPALETFVLPPALYHAHMKNGATCIPAWRKNYFIGTFALKYSLNLSSCGNPSIFIILVVIVYFPLHPEDDLALCLSYRRILIYTPGFSVFF